MQLDQAIQEKDEQMEKLDEEEALLKADMAALSSRFGCADGVTLTMEELLDKHIQEVDACLQECDAVKAFYRKLEE